MMTYQHEILSFSGMTESLTKLNKPFITRITFFYKPKLPLFVLVSSPIGNDRCEDRSWITPSFSLITSNCLDSIPPKYIIWNWKYSNFYPRLNLIRLGWESKCYLAKDIHEKSYIAHQFLVALDPRPKPTMTASFGLLN